MLKETRQPAFPGPLFITAGEGQPRGPYWSDAHLSAPRTDVHPFVSLHASAFKVSVRTVQELLDRRKGDEPALAATAYTEAAAKQVLGAIVDAKAG